MTRAADAAESVFYPAVLGKRQRLLAGVLGLGLGIGVPIALSTVLVASTGDPSLLILPLPFIGLMWAIQGLAPAGFSLDADELWIERRWLRRRIPYASITAVDRRPRRVGGLFALGGNGLFGAHGVRWNRSTGWHYLAITNTEDLVYLHTSRGLVVVSPSRPDEFVAALSRRLAGPGSERHP